MKKALLGFTGVAGLLGVMVFIAWLETPEATPFIVGLLKVAALFVVLSVIVGFICLHNKKKAARVVVPHVRQLGEEGYWYLYIVTFNGFGEVVGYVREDVPGYFGTEELELSARLGTCSIGLEDAAMIAR